MFSSLQDPVSNFREIMDPNIGIILKKVCEPLYPHSDPGFIHADRDHDSWFVPLSELKFDITNKLGQGNFGSVYSGT